MCGILGVWVNVNKDVHRNLFELFAAQSSRGTHGAGISINGAAGLERFRSISPFRLFAFYNWKVWTKIKVGSRVLVHHRYPTSTPNECRFNHPISSEDSTIHVIHNGIIGNADSLYKTLKTSHKWDTGDKDKFTDSEVCVHLLEEGMAKEKDILKALMYVYEQCTGSFALAYNIKGDDNIYLIKHSCPIVISKDKHGNHYFSSEFHKQDGMEEVYELNNGEIGVLTSKGYVELHKMKIVEPVYPKWKGWSNQFYDYRVKPYQVLSNTDFPLSIEEEAFISQSVADIQQDYPMIKQKKIKRKVFEAFCEEFKPNISDRAMREEILNRIELEFE